MHTIKIHFIKNTGALRQTVSDLCHLEKGPSHKSKGEKALVPSVLNSKNNEGIKSHIPSESSVLDKFDID